MRVRNHTNPFNITQRFDPKWLAHLPPDQPLDVEIGFGRGVFLRYWAAKHLLHKVIGIEVRKQMVDILQSRVDDQLLPQLQLLHGNGLFFLQDCVPDNRLDRLFIFHPDPWFKKRHRKRRVVTDQYSQLLFQKLKPTGKLYVSTDVDLLWQDMCQTLTVAGFKALPQDDFWQTHYNTHWHEFSITDNRTLFFQTFQK